MDAVLADGVAGIRLYVSRTVVPHPEDVLLRFPQDGPRDLDETQQLDARLQLRAVIQSLPWILWLDNGIGWMTVERMDLQLALVPGSMQPRIEYEIKLTRLKR
jgi:hypothetical protein